MNGGAISAATFSQGNAGSIKVTAASIYIDEQTSPFGTGIFSSAQFDSSGNAGDIEVSATGALSMVHGGSIGAFTQSIGAAGSITVNAQSLTIDGQRSVFFTGIATQADPGSSGAGGQIQVTVPGALSIADGGLISSKTFGRGAAGSITVHAGSIAADARGSPFPTGIFGDSDEDASGDAGRLDISATGTLALRRGAQIASNTSSVGNAGAIKVHAGAIDFNGTGGRSRPSGIFASADIGSSGHGAGIDIEVDGNLALLNGGAISSSTASTGNAGSIKVKAEQIAIGGGSNTAGVFSSTTSSGQAGNIDVSVARTLALGSAGIITAATTGSGDAGSMTVRAESISVDGQNTHTGFGIQTISASATTGNAGDITVSAQEAVSVIRGGFISASSGSPLGRSGSVSIDAGSLLVDGTRSEVSASARDGSLGQTGSLAITVANAITLANGGKLSIQNDASVADPRSILPTLLSVSASSITLANGGQITTESTGNISASNIAVSFIDRLVLDPSLITTSANQGNGGGIRITGNGVVLVDDSQITTSVSGPSGNGGDIVIRAAALVMKTGFIQANTAGTGASGGNVIIDVQTLVPSGNTLTVGGSTLLPFQPGVFASNVIQAAAPTGVSGTIDVTAPTLDIAGSLRGLSTDVVKFGVLGRDLCRVGASSSLTPVGRGGLRPTSSGMIRPEAATVRSSGDVTAERNTGSDRLARQEVAGVVSHGRCEY